MRIASRPHRSAPPRALLGAVLLGVIAATPHPASAQSLFGLFGKPAATSPSATFVAKATLDANVLEASARLALEHSTVPRVRDFARGVVRDEVRFANALGKWSDAAVSGGFIPAASGGTFAAVLVAGLGGQSGLANAATGQLVPSAEAKALTDLQALSSPEFDKRFIELEARITADELSLTESYAERGEDPGLRRIARAAVGSLRQRLGTLQKRV